MCEGITSEGVQTHICISRHAEGPGRLHALILITFAFFFKNNSFSFHFAFFLLFSTLKKIGNIENCPYTYWLNWSWFLQIVDGANGNLYPIYPLFPYSDCYLKYGVGLGGGDFLAFYAISNIYRKKQFWE